MTTRLSRGCWIAFLVGALLFLDAGTGNLYGVIVPAAALALAVVLRGRAPAAREHHLDREDLLAVGGLYVGVVGLFVLAFRVFTQDNVLGLFLCFGGGMLLGVVGPIYYSVWRRNRPLADLGLSRDQLPSAAGLGVLLAAIQFGLTLWGYQLPEPVNWVPLAVLSVVVGLFEVVFFRGFVQSRLEGSLGSGPGIAAAAGLYALYHVGYGMGAGAMLFLFGLGVVYALAYAVVRNILVLWPLLIPTGSFYNNLTSGEITMPWASILGFVDVLALMAVAVWLGARRQRRTYRRAGTERPPMPAAPAGA